MLLTLHRKIKVKFRAVLVRSAQSSLIVRSCMINQKMCPLKKSLVIMAPIAPGKTPAFSHIPQPWMLLPNHTFRPTHHSVRSFPKLKFWNKRLYKRAKVSLLPRVNKIIYPRKTRQFWISKRSLPLSWRKKPTMIPLTSPKLWTHLTSRRPRERPYFWRFDSKLKNYRIQPLKIRPWVFRIWRILLL